MTELSWKKKAIDKATGGLYDKKSKKIIRYAKKKAKKPSNKGFLCFLDARGGNIMKKSAKKLMAAAMAALMAASMTACGGSKTETTSAADTTAADAAETTAAGAAEAAKDGEKKVLKVAMECAYAPYNWTQPDDSNGAVPIADSNEYAYGYDVMMAKKICEELGMICRSSVLTGIP